MPNSRSARAFALTLREMQESRNSLVWTPVGIAVGLVLIMLLSVLLANRMSVLGGTMLHVLLEEESASETKITINIDREDGEKNTSYTVERSESPVDEEEWDFSKEWDFEPGNGEELQDKIQEKLDGQIENLNPVLNMVYNFMILVLFIVSTTYLLASLYNDRKDRSILFWRSMPVSEWEEVLSKLGVALVVVPVIFIAISLVIQVAYILIAMLLVWRMDMDPFELVIGNIEFGSLLFNQIAGWMLTAVLITPIYAWLMLASAAAKRSPFMLAIAPIIALVVVEKVFLGTEFFADAVDNHLPHITDGGDSLGFFIYGPEWSAINYLSVLWGLVFAAVALTGAVYLRRYRFEI